MGSAPTLYHDANVHVAVAAAPRWRFAQPGFPHSSVAKKKGKPKTALEPDICGKEKTDQYVSSCRGCKTAFLDIGSLTP